MSMNERAQGTRLFALSGCALSVDVLVNVLDVQCYAGHRIGTNCVRTDPPIV